jgi:hypothetical protein
MINFYRRKLIKRLALVVPGIIGAGYFLNFFHNSNSRNKSNKPLFDFAKIAINSPNKMQIKLTNVGVDKQPLLIIDNIYQYPEYVREIALDLFYYQDVFRNLKVDTAESIAVISIPQEDLISVIYDNYAKHFERNRDEFTENREIEAKFTMFKTNPVPKKDNPKKLLGKIFLNQPEQCNGGLGLYVKNNQDWKLIKKIDMLFNRLVCYPAAVFHRSFNQPSNHLVQTLTFYPPMPFKTI